MIRVLIADDHAVVRSGLTQLLASAPDVEVVATACDGHQAVDLAALHRPDIVLMDLSMPRMNGREATEQITGLYPAVRVVVLTSFSDRTEILAALRAGAVGYLLKDAEPEELIQGLRSALEGDMPLAPRAVTALLDAER